MRNYKNKIKTPQEVLFKPENEVKTPKTPLDLGNGEFMSVEEQEYWDKYINEYYTDDPMVFFVGDSANRAIKRYRRRGEKVFLEAIIREDSVT